jgi:single-strand DNA-binding protein
MSNGINRVTLGGNLGSDPELKMTQNGTAVLKLRLATNEAYYDKDRNLVERTDWHDVVVFGNRAEALLRILAKGESVVVDGSIRTSTYEKEGRTMRRVEIMARDVMLTGKRKSVASPPPVDDDPFAPADPPAAEADTVDEVQPARSRGRGQQEAVA